MTTTIVRAELIGSAEPVHGTSGALISDLKGAAVPSEGTPNEGSQLPLSVNLHSTVIANTDSEFVETGTLSNGEKDRVIFDTKKPGIITSGSNAASNFTIGAIILNIVDGTGKYANSTGLITSNFIINSDNIVTDNITAVIFH